MSIEVLPQGVTHLDAPCWHVVNQDGEPDDTGDGIPHYDTEDEAVARIAVLPEGTPAGWSWRAEPVSDEPCVVATCTKCGYRFEEDVMAMHHESVEEAAEAVLESGEWKIGPSGIRCPGCVEEN